jgi:Mg-chelatase subunit ChlI
MAVITRWLTRALDYLAGVPEVNGAECNSCKMTQCSRCRVFLPVADAKVLTHGIFCPECISLTPRQDGIAIAAPGYVERIFADIIGYEDLKKEFVKALLSPSPVGILLIGPPGTCKSEFLRKIEAAAPERSEFIDGCYGSKAGIFAKLYENRPSIVLMDELDKLDSRNQEALLNLMETGIMKKTTKAESYEIQLNAWVFATANIKENIMEPLIDRFETYYLLEYADEEFRKIAVSRLRQEGVNNDNLSLYIANAVLKTLGKKSFRAAIRIANKCKSIQEVDETVQTLKKYNQD